MDHERMLRRLGRPEGPVDVVLDTDTYNEIDDQYALSYMLKSAPRLTTRALYAAPFFNANSTSPENGMERSYEEILHLLKLMGREELNSVVFQGSRTYLPDENTPVESPAARDLVARSKAYSEEHPLYVVAIGAITNVASALLMDPTLKDRIVLVWLGGNALNWPDNKEFNLMQDVAAARVVFGCGVPLVQLPCAGVVDHFTSTGPELEHWFRGRNALCDYLIDHTIEEAESYAHGKPWSRVIWDVTAVAWLTDERGEFLRDRLETSPIPQYDHRWSRDCDRHFYRYVYHINRDALMGDLINRLTH